MDYFSIKYVFVILCLILYMLALPVPAYFRALPTSAERICPLLEVCLYWRVSFGACGMSVVRNSEVVCYSGAVNVLRLRE